MLFVRATRQKLWGRMTPVYLSSMFSLRKDDRETWYLISSNFCCNKTIAPFLAIGGDHCLEQVNKELKVTGGIVGLSGDCLTAPIKRLILAKFEESIRLNKTSSDSDYIQHEYRGLRVISQVPFRWG